MTRLMSSFPNFNKSQQIIHKNSGIPRRMLLEKTSRKFCRDLMPIIYHESAEALIAFFLLNDLHLSAKISAPSVFLRGEVFRRLQIFTTSPFDPGCKGI